MRLRLTRLTRLVSAATFGFLWATASCARILGIDDLTERRETGDSSVARIDVGRVEPGACDPSKPFGEPQAIPGIGTTSVNAWLWVSEDETTLYFSKLGNTTGFDLYRAARHSRSEPFSNIEPVSGLQSPVNDVDPNVTRDRSVIYFSRRLETTSYDLYMATRDGGADFSDPVPLPGDVNSARLDSLPFFSEAAGELWFSSNRQEDKHFSLYRAKGNGASFETPLRVTDFNTYVDAASALDESAPILSADAKTLFFASGHRGVPDEPTHYNIWTAHRDDLSQPFGEPTLLREVSSPDQDMPSAISPDGCRLYFTRYLEDPGKAPYYDLYVAERGR